MDAIVTEYGVVTRDPTKVSKDARAVDRLAHASHDRRSVPRRCAAAQDAQSAPHSDFIKAQRSASGRWRAMQAQPEYTAILKVVHDHFAHFFRMQGSRQMPVDVQMSARIPAALAVCE